MRLFKWLSVSVYLYLACAGVAAASTEKSHALKETIQPSTQHHWPAPKAIPSSVATTFIHTVSAGDLSDASDNHWVTRHDILPSFDFSNRGSVASTYLVTPKSTITPANRSRAPPTLKS